MKKKLIFLLPLFIIFLSACGFQKPAEVLEVESETMMEDQTEPEAMMAVDQGPADIIKQALADKNNIIAQDIKISLDYNDGQFASGTVGPAEDGMGGGGYFYAVLVDGEWVIAADGNGTIACSDIEPYDFPVELISECWDDDSQEIIER